MNLKLLIISAFILALITSTTGCQNDQPTTSKSTQNPTTPNPTNPKPKTPNPTTPNPTTPNPTTSKPTNDLSKNCDGKCKGNYPYGCNLSFQFGYCNSVGGCSYDKTNNPNMCCFKGC